jgi:hypothetical protein
VLFQRTLLLTLPLHPLARGELHAKQARWTCCETVSIQIMTTRGPEALLLWCKTHTSGYQNVSVNNFHTSWKDGLALCALVHKFHPEILQFEALSKDQPLENLELALSAASKLGMLDYYITIKRLTSNGVRTKIRICL